MKSFKKFQKAFFFKAIIVPVLILIIAVLGTIKYMPAVENRLPNINEYSWEAED